MSFGSKINDYKEEFLRDFDELLRIKSVSADGNTESKEALRWMLQKAERREKNTLL